MEFLRLLAGLRNPVIDTLMLIISDLGNPVIATGLIVWFYLNVNKKETCGMGAAFLSSLLLAQGLKISFRIPRPWILDPDFHASKQALSTATGYSFPSVHTQSTASIGTSALLTVPKKRRLIRRITIAMMILVPFSRMWLGCHTPFDVIVGFIVGVGITFLIQRLWQSFHGHLHVILFSFLLAFSAILLFLGGFLTANGTVDFLLAKDTFESAGLAVGFAVGTLLERKCIHFQNEGRSGQYILRFLIAIGGMLAIELIGRNISNTSAVLVTVRYALIGFYPAAITPFLCIHMKLMQADLPPYEKGAVK